MVKRINFLILILLLTQNSFAQSIIKGTITDSTNAPLPYVAVGLMYVTDSAVVKSVLTDEAGIYIFSSIKQGNYFIKAQATGYAEQRSSSIKTDSGSTFQIPVMQLKSKGYNLKGVTVVADKPFMERREDRMIFNLENSIIATGKNGLEVLNQLPGVSASDNGVINVMGKGGVMVMVDDRPIHVDIATYLKSIDASQIEKIEVITNPSAKYEAAGKAIINIVLKRDKNLGLNGEFTSSYRQATYANFSEILNINYRTKKWNIFGNFNENIFDNTSTHEITRTFSNNNIVQQVFTESAPNRYHGTVSSANIGFDYMPTKKQTLSFSVDGYLQAEHIHTYDNTVIYGQNSMVDSSLYIPIFRTYKASQTVYDFNYKNKIDTAGKEFSADVQYGVYGSTENQQNPTYYYNSDGLYLRPSTQLNSSQITNISFGLAKADYTQPLGKNAKLEMGVQATYVSDDNNAEFYTVNKGSSVLDSTKSNEFNLTEDVFAAYLNYSQKLGKKLDFQLGIRCEDTYDKGIQYVHDTSFTRNYINPFPSAAINWVASANHTFSLSYSRRIDRPDFDALNPFIILIDPYTYTQGNIALLPQLSDHYELAYNYKNYLSVNLEHYYFSNVITPVYRQNDSTHVSYSTFGNLSSYSEYNIMVIASIPITKWWNTVTSVNVYHDNYYGTLFGTNVSRTHFSGQFKTLNTFTFKNKWNAEISFFYYTINLNGVSEIEPIYGLDAGIGKRFFNDRLNVKLAYSDILISQIDRVSSVYQNVNIQDKQYMGVNRLRFSLTWKFGKSEYQREENNKAKNLGNIKGG